MKLRLDDIDWKILSELQDNGRITNVELAKRVGISAPPCLRRVRALEQQGLITGYRGLINTKQLGYEVIGFAFVGLSHTRDTDLVAFETKVASWPIVRECHLLSGDIDFLLKCVAQDFAEMQHFVINELTSQPMVGSVRTALTIRETKNVGALPVLTPSSEDH